MTYERPDLTVDVVLLTMLQGRLHVALMRRDKAPEEGKWALTGGYIHTNEDASGEDAALRTLHAKLEFAPRYIEQAFTEANAHRDPRGWSASIVYLALNDPEVLSGLVERQGLQLFDVEDDGEHLPENMAFDHRVLLTKAVARLRNKAAYSTIAGHFLPECFMIPELQGVMEAVLGRAVNSANFRHKILKTGVLEEGELLRSRSGGRPGQGYRLKDSIAYFDHELF